MKLIRPIIEFPNDLLNEIEEMSFYIPENQ